MSQPLEGQRESWGTRGAFILAAIGSAVGLGNLWGFPYKIYDNGGAAFLIPYIIALFVVGLPVLILEFSMGHFTQRAAPDAFSHGHKRFEFVGWWGIILGFVIVTFYPVILGYCLNFLWYSVQGIFNGGELPWAAAGPQGVEKAKSFFYDTYLKHHDSMALGAIQMKIVWSLIASWILMYLCIFKGVNLVGKIVWLTVPLPWLMLLVLTVNGLTLPGSMKGLIYYLNPDFTELLSPTTWKFAFGQAFFSLSLAFGVMITYASFLHRKSDLNNNAAIICLSDFATSFVAGLAVFSTLGAMTYVTAQAGTPVAVEDVVEGGPGLAFVAFPYALAQLPASAWWSAIFFFTLITLGIDSAFSITESVLASIVDKSGWKRTIVLPVMSVIGLAIGLIFTTKGGLNWLGVVADAIYGTWGIAFVGLAECIVLGWLWRIEYLRRHANSRSDWKLGKWWDYLIRIFIPVILGTLFIWSLFDDITKHGGFLLDSEGKLIIQNLIGTIIMILAPIAAFLIALWPSKSPQVNSENDNLFEPETGGHIPGMILLAFALISLVIIAVLFVQSLHNEHNTILLWISLIPAIIALFAANILVDIYNRKTTQSSWYLRWAGLVATIDVSGFFAICLIYNTGRESVEKIIKTRPEQLSMVSYLILVVVLLLIIGGFGWCFYRSLTAARTKTEEPQPPDEVGDDEESQQQ